jgi:lysozyme
MRWFVGWCALVFAGCSGGGIGSVQSAMEICPTGPVVQGVDVSHYEGTIDWAQVHGSGIDFAFIKATESTDFIDPNFATNWQEAGAAGVVRGAYHFFRPEVDPVAQADYFIATAGIPLPGDLPLTLDLEVTDTDTAAETAQSALTFLARVAAQTGRTPIVYTSQSFYGSTLGAPAGFGGYTLWVANWQVTCPNLPTAWSGWQFWQHADNGTVAGITGTANVDLDEFNGTLADLKGFAGATNEDGGVGDDEGSVVDAGRDAGVGEEDGGAKKKPAVRGGCAVGGDDAGEGALVLVLLACVLSRAWARPAGFGRRRRA